MGTELPAGVVRELTRLAGMAQAIRARASIPAGGVDDPSTRVAAMAAALYAQWYLQPSGGGGERVTEVPLDRDDLSGVLRAVHAGATRFTDGWVVQAVLGGGACLVGRGTQQRVAEVGTYVSLYRPGVPVAPGEQVALARIVDRIDTETGWWGCQSERGEPVPPVGRHYLHPRLPAAAGIVHALTDGLLDADHEWSIKCPLTADGWNRPDALVLYAPTTATPRVRTLLAALVARSPDDLLPHLPPLTERIGVLVGYAEDPGGEHSFGSHVCQALAPGALELAAAGRPSANPVSVLAASLAAAGVDPAQPWLVGPRG